MGNIMPIRQLEVRQYGSSCMMAPIRTLIDVRLVPKLKKDLICLCILDSNGYKYTAEGRVLRGIKGALVIMQGKKVAALICFRASLL